MTNKGFIVFAVAATMALSSVSVFAAEAKVGNAKSNLVISTRTVSSEDRIQKTSPDLETGLKRIKIGFICNIETAASLLGLTADELTEKVKNGENFCQLLEDAGKFDEYKTAVIAKEIEKIQKLVANEKLTQTKADEIIAELTETVNSMNSENGMFDIKIGIRSRDIINPGLEIGFGMNNGADERGVRSGIIINTNVLCDLLSITETELKEMMTQGNLFTTLEEKGLLDEYKQKIIEQYTARLQETVSAGKMTQEDADKKVAEFETIIDNFDFSNMPEFKFQEKGSKQHSEKTVPSLDEQSS